MNKIPKKIMVITVTDDRNYPAHFWEEPLRKNSEELIWIDLKKLYFNNGREKTHQILLNAFEKEKPDYLFMFDSLYYDLDLPLLLTKLKILSPKTKSVFWSGDDDVKFESVRYLALFFDHIFVAHKNFIEKYEQDGLSNLSFLVQSRIFDSVKFPKIHDVSFIGTPKADRKEILEYLTQNKVNLKVFGYSWDKYLSLKRVYGGVLSSNEYLQTITQSKINLCFSKNSLGAQGMKGRFLEISACNAFALVEYDYHLKELFKEKKEIVFFKSKKELLSKIKYYLKREDERIKIAKSAFDKVNSDFNFEEEIKKFIKKGIGIKPQITTSISEESKLIEINELDMRLSKKDLLEKIKNFDYVSLSKGNPKKSNFKNKIQMYSLKKNKKQISCCDYFIHNEVLGDYSRFTYCPEGKNPQKDYSKYLNINQFVFTRNFFVKNFHILKKSYSTEIIDFVNNKNTAFVSLPLVSLSRFRKGFFDDPEFSNELGLFLFSAHRELYSKRKNLISFVYYLLFLIFFSITGQKFIFDNLRIKYRNTFKRAKSIK